MVHWFQANMNPEIESKQINHFGPWLVLIPHQHLLPGVGNNSLQFWNCCNYQRKPNLLKQELHEIYGSPLIEYSTRWRILSHKYQNIILVPQKIFILNSFQVRCFCSKHCLTNPRNGAFIAAKSSYIRPFLLIASQATSLCSDIESINKKRIKNNNRSFHQSSGFVKAHYSIAFKFHVPTSTQSQICTKPPTHNTIESTIK